MTDPKWLKKERRSAKKHNAKHVGGPGRSDYVRGCVRGEVKDRKQPLTKPQVIHAVKRNIAKGACKVEIVSTSGFTKPAEEHVQRYYKKKVKLMRR